MSKLHQELLKDVTRWLGETGAYNLRPLLVSIGRSEYPAVEYHQTRRVLEGCRAWREGGREYLIRAVYCVGAVPPSYRRSSNTVYREQCGAEWYIFCYCDNVEELEQWQQEMYHPVGNSFMLAPLVEPSGVGHPGIFEGHKRMKMRIREV